MVGEEAMANIVKSSSPEDLRWAVEHLFRYTVNYNGEVKYTPGAGLRAFESIAKSCPSLNDCSLTHDKA